MPMAYELHWPNSPGIEEVFGSATGGGADAQAPDFQVHVELLVMFAQLFSNVD